MKMNDEYLGCGSHVILSGVNVLLSRSKSVQRASRKLDGILGADCFCAMDSFLRNVVRLPQFLSTKWQVFRCLNWRQGSKHFIAPKPDSSIARTPPINTAGKDRIIGKYALITGASSGLGLTIATELHKCGMNVCIVCRDSAKGELAVKSIKDSNPDSTASVTLRIADLAVLKQVKHLASELITETKQLSVLVNNAGCLATKMETTEDGFEASFAVNTLGTFALTELLMPLLSKSTQESGFISRVITISSGGMLLESLDVNDVQGKKIQPFDGSRSYSRSKRAQVAFTEWWAQNRGENGKDIQFFSMHPGWSDTPGLKKSLPEFYKGFKDKLRTQLQGADTVLWLAAASSDDVKNGEFFFDRKISKKHLTLSGTAYSTKVLNKYVLKVFQILEEHGIGRGTTESASK